MNKDICYDNNGIKFNFRVSCIIWKNNKILLHRKKKDFFWNFIGGRVRIGESTNDALKREIREELGCKCEINKMVRVCENFFEFNNQRYHEILMIFKGELLDELKKENIEDDLVVEWFEEKDLKNIDIRPEFVKKILMDKNYDLEWIVNDELK